MDDKQIKILLMFGTDAGKANAELQKMNEKFAQLGKRAEELRGVIDLRKSMGLDSGEIQQDLKSVESEMEKVAEDARKAKVAIDGMAKGSRDVRDNLYQLRDIGEKLNQIGMGMQNAGNALLSPLQGAMAAYMEQQTAIQEAGGKMSKSAKAYLDAQEQMQQAYIRIGAVAANKLVPLIEKGADMLTKFADFLEQHPELVTAIAGLGVGLVGLGKVASLAGQVYMIAGSLQSLGIIGGGAAGGGMLAGIGTSIGTAVTTALTSTLFLGTLAAGLGAMLGVGAYNKYAEETGRDSAGELWKKTKAISAFGSLQRERDRTGGTETDQELWALAKAEAGLGDAAEDAASSTEKTAAQLRAEAEAAEKAAAANKQFTDALENFKLESARAEEDYNRERAQVQADGQKALLDSQRNHLAALKDMSTQYDAQVKDIKANFAQQEAQAAAQYQQQRAQAIADAQQVEQEARADHLEALRKLEEEHNRNVWQITQDRDALALTEEERRYGDSVSEENRNFQMESAKRRQELQARLAEMAAQYQAERAQRAQEYAQSLADAKAKYEEQVKRENEQYAAEQKKIQEQQAERLRQMDTQYQLERKRRMENFAMQIRDLDFALLTETNRKQAYYQMQLAGLDQFLAEAKRKIEALNASSLATTTHRASGGYAKYGKYTLGEVGTEWVANAQTTKALEGMAGGSLTQDRLLAMAARGSVSSQKQISVNLGGVTFNGDISAANKSAFKTFMENIALQTFENVMQGA